jgi:hypothetical protein
MCSSIRGSGFRVQGVGSSPSPSLSLSLSPSFSPPPQDFALQQLLLAVGRHDKIVWLWSIAAVGEGQSMRALKHSRGTLVCGHVLRSDKDRDHEVVRVVLNIGMDLFRYSMLWAGNTNTRLGSSEMRQDE